MLTPTRHGCATVAPGGARPPRSRAASARSAARAGWRGAGGDHRPRRPAPTRARSRSRRGATGEPWFCFEQPDRDGAALAALGCVRAMAAAGPSASRASPRAWRELAGRRGADAPDGPAGAGLVAVGGFAFAPDGGARAALGRLRAGALTVPEVALARRGEDVRLTLAALVAPDDMPEELVARLERRVSPSCAPAPLPLLDPAPAGRSDRLRRAAGALRGRGRARRRADPRRRAREDRARPRGRGPRARRRTTPPRCSACCARLRVLLRVLRRAWGRRLRGRLARAAGPPRGPARLDASRWPARSGAAPTRPSTTTSASSCCARDKDREEQAIVARRIARALRPHAVWVAAARGAGDRQGREHPAPGDADPRAARAAAQRGRAGRAAAPDARGGRRAARRRHAADPRAARAWTAAGTRARSAGRTPTRTASSASPCAARCCAAARRAVRRRRRRARLRPGGRAGRDRGQARRAAAGAVGLALATAVQLSSHDLVERLAVRRLDPRLGRAALRDPRGWAGWPNVSTVATAPSGRFQQRAIASRSSMPFGQAPMPSAHAASSMFCAARPGVDAGPAAVTIATTNAAPQHVGGRVDGLGHPLDRPFVADDHERPPLAVLRRARDPARVEDPPLGLGRERPRGVVAHLASRDDGQVGVHPSRRLPAGSRRRHLRRRALARAPAVDPSAPRSSGSALASAASIVSVTRRERDRRHLWRVDEAPPLGLVVITMPSKMCSRALSCTRWTVPIRSPPDACTGTPRGSA